MRGVIYHNEPEILSQTNDSVNNKNVDTCLSSVNRGVNITSVDEVTCAYLKKHCANAHNLVETHRG